MKRDGKEPQMAHLNETVTYILRCHSVSTLPKLRSALMSVAAQRYPNVKALIALQDLAEGEAAQVVEMTDLVKDATGLNVTIENYSFENSGDHRGALLNRSLAKVQSRYAAFLDYDDVVYPNHAETLIADLLASEDQSAVASFGGCCLAFYDDIDDFSINITKKYTFSEAPSVSACIIGNCFPIHCYILDLSKIDNLPKFSESNHLFEDYLFLLGIFELYPVSVQKAKTQICEYRINNNNSNTVTIGTNSSDFDPQKAHLWIKAQRSIEAYKTGKSFRLPYEEVVNYSDSVILARQPFLRGLFICAVAKSVRKKFGSNEAAKFLKDPKGYSRALPKERRSVLIRMFF